MSNLSLLPPPAEEPENNLNSVVVPSVCLSHRTPAAKDNKANTHRLVEMAENIETEKRGSQRQISPRRSDDHVMTLHDDDIVISQVSVTQAMQG